MLPICRILFPMDFSQRCVEMIPHLRTVARTYNSEITLLHVVNGLITIPDAGLWPPNVLPVPQLLLDEQKERLETLAKENLADLRVKVLVREGLPELEIAAVAKELDSQLVIMPTHGYGIFRQFLLGSITSKVLHDVHGPVLTGAHLQSAAGAEAYNIRNLVCAIDLGPVSVDVLTWAARIATDFHASLSLVHCSCYALPDFDPSLSVDARREREAYIRGEIERLKAVAGIKASTVYIEEGEPAATICNYAASVGADLLVIGRGEKNSGAGRLRANAYSIIRQSSSPVLSV